MPLSGLCSTNPWLVAPLALCFALVSPVVKAKNSPMNHLHHKIRRKPGVASRIPPLPPYPSVRCAVHQRVDFPFSSEQAGAIVSVRKQPQERGAVRNSRSAQLCTEEQPEKRLGEKHNNCHRTTKLNGNTRNEAKRTEPNRTEPS